MLYCPPASSRTRLTLPGRARRKLIVPDDVIDLARLRTLDPKALTAIHERYYARLFRYSTYRTGDPRLAEDITSEVFLRLLAALKKGAGPKTNLAGWLHRTAYHAINDHFRQAKRHPAESLSEEDVPLEDKPHESAEVAEQTEAVRKAMAKLTENQQHVLALRFGSGLSLRETADAMGKAPNAIKALQFRALRALRRTLGESWS